MPDDEPLDDARQVATAAATAAARLIETAAREARDAAAQHRATLERSQDQRRAQETLAQLGHHVAPQAQAVRTGPTELAQAEAWASPERLRQRWSDREGSDSTAGRADADRALVREWKAATAPGQSQRGQDQLREDQRRSDLAEARAWATPERLKDYHDEQMGCDSAEGRQSADARLVREWRTATDTEVRDVPDENDAWDRHNERRSAAEDALYDSPEQRAKRDSDRAAASVPADAREVRATSDLMNGTDPVTAAAGSHGRGSTNSSSQYDHGRQARLTEQAPPKVQRVQQVTPTR